MTKKNIIAKFFALLLAVAIPVMFMSCEKEEPTKPNTEGNGGENNGGGNEFQYTNQLNVNGTLFDFTMGSANVNSGTYTFVKITNDDESVRANIFFPANTPITGSFVGGDLYNGLQEGECFVTIYFPGAGEYAITLNDVQLTIENNGDNFGLRCGGYCDFGEVAWNYFGSVENL